MKNTHVLRTDTFMKVTRKSTKKKNSNVNYHLPSLPPSQLPSGSKLHQYDHSKIQEMVYDMETKFNRNFLNDVEVI